MTTQETLLSFVLERYILPDKNALNENVATDALSSILNRSKAARQGLSDMLQAIVKGISPIASVKTQLAVAGGYDRPDMTCFDDGGAKTVLLEAKFFTGPTPGQPNSYWKDLPDTPSALVFLVPTRTLDNWRQVLTQSLKSQGFKSGKVNSTSDLVSIPEAKGQRCLILISWDELLRRLEESAISNKDYQASFEVAQLRSIVKSTSSQVGLCLCGCGKQPKGSKSKYWIGDDSKVASMLKAASESRPPYSENLRLPDVLVEYAKANPQFQVHGYDTCNIRQLADKVGVRETRIAVN